MSLRSTFAALAATLLAVPGVARAGVTGQVTLDHFSYTLVDLDPNDGIAPSLTFQPGSGQGSLIIQYNVGDKNYSPSADGSNASYQAPGLTTGGSYSGLSPLEDASLNVHAAADPAYGQPLGAWASVNAGWFDFVLSPNTALTVQATVHFAGEVTAGDTVDRLDMDGDLWLTGHAANGDLVSRQFTADSGLMNQPTAAFDRIENVVGTYSNDSAASFAGSLLLYATVYAVALPGAGTGLPAPVPEPANVAMLAAGLPLLLALRRRTRRRTRA